MFDIGAMELLVLAVVALIVVGPKDLPRLLRSVGGMVRKARDLSYEIRRGIEHLADEVERETDPFRDERKREGLKPGMSPEEVTDHIMANRARETGEKTPEQPAEAAPEAPKAGDKPA